MPFDARIPRRESLGRIAAAAATAWCSGGASLSADGPLPQTSQLGLVIYCSRLRRDEMRRKDAGFDLFSPDNFLAHCMRVGAGGMQLRLGVMGSADATTLRNQLEAAGRYVEAIVSLPTSKEEMDRFDAEMRTAASAGALAARTTIIPGRRYEYFESLAAFRQAEARARRNLERAAPVAEKYRLPLAVENHKDQRDDERVRLLESISSEFVGACVDTGNSIALLEDPLETARKLAPWAHSVHLKDQAVQLYDDGFLLADIPLGQGFIDLKAVVDVIRQQRPGVRFSLELITRDPLKVPCLTDAYWATMPNVPGRDLARTLQRVRAGASDNLPRISNRSTADQVAAEDRNVAASLSFARSFLGLN